MGSKAPSTLVYDGECRICRRSVDWVLARIPESELEARPLQDPSVGARFPGATAAELERAMHLFESDGTVRKGAEAVEEILRRIPRWSWLGKLMGLKPIRPLARGVYGIVAKNRGALGCGEHCSVSEPKAAPNDRRKGGSSST